MDWESLARLLSQTYGDPRHGNPTDPTDSLFYLMLSRKTPIATAGRIFSRLQEASARWDRLADMPEAEIAELLAGSGLEAIRAGHLRRVAGLLRERFGLVTLAPLRNWSDEDCLTFLSALPGVGMKTALCVMLYGLERQVFPADVHCIRVLGRMGVIDAHLAHRPAQRRLAVMVPEHLGYALHVNLVAHGQQVCRAGAPKCGACVVREFCAHGAADGLKIAEETEPYRV
ncbi:MAG TPA: hypothetical protein VD902_17465 [Symbiobacteriaceae bacterium]|nr:hypothetical protein [Symbiobacteriaceae bacterium]